MGGATAEISERTSTVLLEAANFDPQATSATGTRLGLLSEARTRFERGVDIELAGRAIDRFVELLGPGVRRGSTTDVRSPRPPQAPVRLRTDRVNHLLGTALSPEECARLLAPLGFVTTPKVEREYEIVVPTWRPDCKREVDLIEEVARIYGYENIPRSLPARPTAATGLTAYQTGRRRVREALAGAGADEAWTPTFVSAADLGPGRPLDPVPALELENPARPVPGFAAHVAPARPAACRPFQCRPPSRCPEPVRTGGACFPCPASPAAAPATWWRACTRWEQLGLVAVGADVDATYAVQAWEVLAGALRLWEDAPVVPLDRAGAAADRSRQRPRCRRGLRTLQPGGGGHDRRPPGRCGGRTSAPRGGLSFRPRFLPCRVAVLIVDLAPVLGAPGAELVGPAREQVPSRRLRHGLPGRRRGDGGRARGARSGRRPASSLESLVLFDVWRDASARRGPGGALAFHARLRAADRTLTDTEVARVRDHVAAVALEAHGAILRTG